MNVDSISKYPPKSELDISEAAYKRVSSLLSRTVAGSSNILLSAIGRNNDPDKVLESWDRIFSENSKAIDNELRTIELSNRAKYEPRSIALPWEVRKKSTYEYFNINTQMKSISIPDGTIRRSQRPISLSSAIDVLKNSTNSGLPDMIRKSEVKDELSANFDYFKSRRDPCVLFTRTQEGGKTRDVWGYPAADVAHEQRFYQPILKIQRTKPWRNAIVGPASVQKHMNELLKMASASGKTLVSGDFPAYDKSLSPEGCKSAFDYFKLMFQVQYLEDIDYIAERFSSIGLVTPDGLITGSHGVPSGSTFTNEVDSVVQYLILSNGGIKDNEMDIQGDDNVILTHDPEYIYDLFGEQGLFLNEDKTHISSKSIQYLQMLYSKEYTKPDGTIGGIYSTYRALTRIIYLESFDNFVEDDISGADWNAIRTIMILENCKNHPLYVEFVKFILSMDKYKLNVSENGLINYVKRIEKTSGTEGDRKSVV